MKQYIIAAALTAAGITTYACDMCGGGAGSQYIGLLPAFSRSFAGIQYNRNDLSGSFDSPYKGRPDEHTHDVYQTIQLWGRYAMGKYQLFAFIPWQHNLRTGDDGTTLRRDGIGDATLMVNRVFINRESGTLQHTLFGGIGSKLPTGHYTPLAASGSTQSQALSTGTGSWDFTVNANYTLRRGNSGFNADVSALLTTASPDAYRYGSRIGGGLSAFHSWQLRKLRLTPQAGGRYEHALVDYFNYTKGYVNEASGGNILYATAGIQATLGRAGIRASFLRPVAWAYADGTITPNYKTETGIFFLF